jgi:hypothetical protein
MTGRNERSLFGGKIPADQIASDAAITAKFLDGSVTLPKVEAALQVGITNIALSFAAAAEMGTFKVYFNKKVRIDKIRTVVTKIVGSTSAAYVTCGNVSAPSDALVTIAASAAIGEEDSAVPNTYNNVVAKDSYYQLVTSKANNYAGMIELFLEWTAIP